MNREAQSKLSSFWTIGLLVGLGVIVVFVISNRSITDSKLNQTTMIAPEIKTSSDRWGQSSVVNLTTQSTTEKKSKIQSQKSQLIVHSNEISHSQNEFNEKDLPEKTYIVREGDVLSEISLEIYGSVRHTEFLKEANKISDADFLSIGQVLRVPNLPRKITR